MLGVTRVVADHERGVVFRLGRVLSPTRGPGRIWMIPRIYQLVVVDMRPLTIDLRNEELTTKDEAHLTVNAQVHARVVDPTEAAVRVVNYREATTLIARTVLRRAFKEHLLDEVRFGRADIETTLQETSDAATMAWGVTVGAVEFEVIADDESKR